MNQNILQRQQTIDLIIRWSFVLISAMIFALTLGPDALSSMGHRLLNYALFITLTSYLLLPAAHNILGLLANSLSPVLSCFILYQLIHTHTVSAEILFQLSLITLALSLLLNSLRQLSDRISENNSFRNKLIILLTVIVILLPVWLGPWVDVYQPATATINTIISLTPLTHFSVAVQYDYLRSAWFYQNTPFGSLPFSYPGLTTIGLSYLSLIISLQVIVWRVKRYTEKVMHPYKNTLTQS